MPSWQARLVNAYSRLFLRRSDWGDEQALARRARSHFGSPKLLQWLRTRGLRLTPINTETVCGEWLAVEKPTSGVILYFHGGGYLSGSAAKHRPITAALARLSQRRVFSLDYRLAPEHRFPAALDDAVAAYEWLLAQGLSAHSIALAGDSAGGGLVIATLLRLRDAGLPLPACAVCFSAWTDLTGAAESVRTNDGRCAMFRTANISAFAAAYLGEAAAHNPYASPVFADLSQLPPLLLQVGSTELLLDDSRQIHQKIHQKIQAAQGVSRLEVFDDVMHCWQMLDGFVPEARVALAQAAAFICADGSLSNESQQLASSPGGQDEPLRSGVVYSPADDLLRRAIIDTLKAPVADRARRFEQFAREIEAFVAAHYPQRPWTCSVYTGTDGSQIFRGGIGHSLVIDTNGRLWRARSYEDFVTTYTFTERSCEIETLTPLYSQMREYLAKELL